MAPPFICKPFRPFESLCRSRFKSFELCPRISWTSCKIDTNSTYDLAQYAVSKNFKDSKMNQSFQSSDMVLRDIISIKCVVICSNTRKILDLLIRRLSTQRLLDFSFLLTMLSFREPKRMCTSCIQHQTSYKTLRLVTLLFTKGRAMDSSTYLC